MLRESEMGMNKGRASDKCAARTQAPPSHGRVFDTQMTRSWISSHNLSQYHIPETAILDPLGTPTIPTLSISYTFHHFTLSHRDLSFSGTLY
jgi:hypothetical protein